MVLGARSRHVCEFKERRPCTDKGFDRSAYGQMTVWAGIRFGPLLEKPFRFHGAPVWLHSSVTPSPELALSFDIILQPSMLPFVVEKMSMGASFLASPLAHG